MDEYSAGFCIREAGGGGGGSTGNKCGRWNPTTEQVKVLTDLFTSGLRNPNTDQIQKISSQLSFYGKIESKNVFYWFQNQKARERQKRRRVLVDEGNENMQLHANTQASSTKQFSTPEINQVSQPERVIETLQLFPLNSLREAGSEKLKLFKDDSKANTAFTYNFAMEMDRPTLDM